MGLRRLPLDRNDRVRRSKGEVRSCAHSFRASVEGEFSTSWWRSSNSSEIGTTLRGRWFGRGHRRNCDYQGSLNRSWGLPDKTWAPLPRPWVSSAAVRWLRWRGLLVLYRGQPPLGPSEDFLSPIARGERPFLGQTGLPASEHAAVTLEGLGESPHNTCAKWDAEPLYL